MYMLKACLVNYNYQPQWLTDYDFDVTLYDRSDDGIPRTFAAKEVIKTENRGNVDYDKLYYLHDFYDELPEVFLWGKTNLFKYITEQEFIEVKDNKVFTPLIRQDHKTYRDQTGLVNYYDQFGIYYERNDSWYLGQHPAKCQTFSEWAAYINIPSPAYIPFAPGGNYLLTRETVHRYSRDLYKRMADTMPYCTLPGEAQLAERSYYLLWK